MAKMLRPDNVKNHKPLTGPLAVLVWYHHRQGRFYPRLNGAKLFTLFPDQNAIPVNGRTYTHEELAEACGFVPLIWRAARAEERARVAAAHASYHAMKAKYGQPKP